MLWNISTGISEETLTLEDSIESLELLPNGQIAWTTIFLES
jgi:hypothetical protein